MMNVTILVQVFSRTFLNKHQIYPWIISTPNAKMVFQVYLNGIWTMVYVVNKRESETVDVQLYHYHDDNNDYSKLMLNMKGQPNRQHD